MIYIIDDDKSVRRSFEILFASAGLVSMSYACAKKFLDEYTQSGSDLLLLDIHMPEINGLELLRILKEKKINVPVIIITAYDEEESRQCAKDYGIIDYLVKPVDSNALVDLINTSLKRQSS